MLLLAGAQILSGHVHDTVGINIESNLNLGHTSPCGRNPIQTELPQGLIVSRKLSLTLYHIDVHSGLVVSRSRENLAVLGRNRRIPLNQSGGHAAHGLDGQGQRRHVQKQNIACAGIARQLAALYGSADGNALVRIQRLAGLFARDLSHLILHRGNTGRTAHQQHLPQIRIGQPRVLHGILHRNGRLLHQIMGQLIELCPAQIHVKMLRSFRRSRDERQVDIRGHSAGKLLLRLLRRLLQSLHGHLVTGQIHALRLLELSQHPLNDLIVKIIAAQAGIAIGRQNLDDPIPNLNDRDIKSTAAQIIHHDLLLFLIVKPISQRRRRRLIDNPLHIQPRDLTRVLSSLALRIIKIRRNRDNGLAHFLSQITLRVRLQLLQNHSRNLLRGILLPVNRTSVIRPHIPLNRSNGLLRIRDSLTLSRLPHQSLPSLRKSHHRRRSPRPLRIGNDSRLPALHNRHTAIRCPQVNPNNLAHSKYPPKFIQPLYQKPTPNSLPCSYCI